MTSAPRSRRARPATAAATAGLAALLLLLALPVHAQGWDLTLAIGGITEPIYPGSEHSYVVPIIDLRAETRRGPWSFSGSLLQGIDVTWFDPERGLLVSLNLNQGDERRRDVYSVAGFEVDHRASTRRLLSGSPELSNPINGTLMVGVLSPIGIVGASVAYVPTKVTGNAGESTRHGVLASLLHMLVLPVGDRLEMSTLARVEFMDGEAADTWYTADEIAGVRDGFRAGAGLRDASLAAQLRYSLTERVSITGVVQYTRLLGDAGASPFTTARGQTTALLQTEYRF